MRPSALGLQQSQQVGSVAALPRLQGTASAVVVPELVENGILLNPHALLGLKEYLPSLREWF